MEKKRNKFPRRWKLKFPIYTLCIWKEKYQEENTKKEDNCLHGENNNTYEDKGMRTRRTTSGRVLDSDVERLSGIRSYSREVSRMPIVYD